MDGRVGEPYDVGSRGKSTLDGTGAMEAGLGLLK